PLKEQPGSIDTATSNISPEQKMQRMATTLFKTVSLRKRAHFFIVIRSTRHHRAITAILKNTVTVRVRSAEPVAQELETDVGPAFLQSSPFLPP
ncbi:MAG TPA: hypothetical protein DCY03_28115, partial [Planctomycetaceae bacterium]|nr:hypothetical protein [Planctomycetaceae bacterium]